MRSLELLAPARNLECGVAAVDCGADAVYVGPAKFGARAAAGNSKEDIAELCRYAHRFGVKVYATLNTLVRDDELDEAGSSLGELDACGIDAVLVQDLAVAAMARERGIPVHASTQTDNRDAGTVRFLSSLGISRVVLARELSLDEIRAVHDACPGTELEVFVHGALCASYSGACYASERFFGRSANRGVCAQFCRLKFDLTDSAGRVIRKDSHLLSLKDLALLDHLEELAAAGVTSFKIEGRLKEADYVKNVTAAYSQRLDGICAARPDLYRRASFGTVRPGFTPDINKTFNRGYTEYFLRGRRPGAASPDTPKATGEIVGRVKDVRRGYVVAAGVSSFANGDGLCFFDRSGRLCGFRANRVGGNRLYFRETPAGLERGMTLYRNSDAAFERILSRCKPERRVPLDLVFSATKDGFRLEAPGAPGGACAAEAAITPEKAAKPQRENILAQLSRWGGTAYEARHIEIKDGADGFFVPSGVLSSLRHSLAGILETRAGEYEPPRTAPEKLECRAGGAPNREFRPKNVTNSLAGELYGKIGAGAPIATPGAGGGKDALPLMQCKLCLRYELGCCVKYGGRRPEWREPLYLVFAGGRRARLEFDCRACQMNVRDAGEEDT